MDLIRCPHCQTDIFPTSDGDCPSCRKSFDEPSNVVAKAEPPWGPELPEPPPKFVTITQYVDPIEAALAQNCLEDAGIRTFLADANTVSVAWQLSNAVGGIKLQVLETSADQARLVLKQQLQGSADNAEGQTLDSMARQGGPIDESDAPTDDDSEWDEPEPEPTEREKNGERAFRGAVLGLLFFPLEFYASYLLIKILFSDETLAGRARSRTWIAVTINMIDLFAIYRIGSSLF